MLHKEINMTVETFAVFDMQTSEKYWLSENDYISTSLIVLLFPILIYKLLQKLTIIAPRAYFRLCKYWFLLPNLCEIFHRVYQFLFVIVWMRHNSDIFQHDYNENYSYHFLSTIPSDITVTDSKSFKNLSIIACFERRFTQ